MRTPVEKSHTPGLRLAAVALTLLLGALGTGELAGLLPSAPEARPSAATTQEADGLSYTEWDPATAPDYYREVGPAQAGVELDPGQVVYLPLDDLGRAQGVYACVTLQMVEDGVARERGDLRGLRPSGWGHNREVRIVNPDGSVHDGAFYNRSHLLAKSLGGEDHLENMVCGTRSQNVGDNTEPDGGMAGPEGIARRWLRRHPQGCVWYAATPVYEGDEPVCRSVFVDVRSSDGSLDARYEVYNAAFGYEIDYATGSFSQL